VHFVLATILFSDLSYNVNISILENLFIDYILFVYFLYFIHSGMRRTSFQGHNWVWPGI
jgi:hypothetical protein